MLVGLLALATASAFAGAALYVKRRRAAGSSAARRQESLGTVEAKLRARVRHAGQPRDCAGVLGLVAAWQTSDWRWIVGAVLILANWPYTLLGIMPTNNKLKAIAPEAAGPTSRVMIETWGRLHGFRTGLGIAAAFAYLWALA